MAIIIHSAIIHSAKKLNNVVGVLRLLLAMPS